MSDNSGRRAGSHSTSRQDPTDEAADFPGQTPRTVAPPAAIRAPTGQFADFPGQPPRLVAPTASSDPTDQFAGFLMQNLRDGRVSISDIGSSGELFSITGTGRLRQNRGPANRNAAQASASDQTGGEASGSADNSFGGFRNTLQHLRNRRALQELRDRQETASNLSPSSSAIAGPSSNAGDPTRNRHRVIDRNRSIQRVRSFLERGGGAIAAAENDALSSLADLQNAGQGLETASQQIRALINNSENVIAQSSLAAQEYAGEAETNRAIKRRKIGTSPFISSFPGFSYGHYGQVEPGKLIMEIESCDGGTLEGYGAGPANYTAGNVLKNDDSVYCTKGNYCNLVLRHQGATPFCLTELSIKGPPRDYTDPVQEGMVFVSMTADDFLERTTQYRIQYSPSLNPRRQASRDPNNDHIISIHHNSEGTATGLELEDYDCRFAQIPSDFTIQNGPRFHVTTECDDSDSDSGNISRPSRFATDNFISTLFSTASDAASDSEDSNHVPPWNEEYLFQSHLTADGQPRAPISSEVREAVDAAYEATRDIVKRLEAFRARERESASSSSSSNESESENESEAGGASGGASRGPSTAGLMTPLAWFFIERDKSKCIIKFDPPVSGRFILLKMWSPHFSTAGNIDIQSVDATGFAGPRFFPAMKMR